MAPEAESERQGVKIVKFQGGLGNQMFQYAFGQALANAQGGDVLYDTSWFDTVKNSGTRRHFDLEFFKCQINKAPEAQIEKLLLRKAPKMFRRFFDRHVKDKQAMVFDKRLLEIEGAAYYSGYFQSERYFKSLRSALLEEFSPRRPLDGKNTAMLDKITSVEAVSLHVRRGDYLKLAGIYGTCDSAYYTRAAAYIAARVQNPHFFLFSDDLNWVLDHIRLDYPYTAVDVNAEKTAYCDMMLMKACKHNITANSTFSWWGAWLNTHQNKIVLSPGRWVNAPAETYRDVIPEAWTKV